MKKPPTLKEIAGRTGVTANTVSLALRDSPLVTPETKARIQEAARDMGYVYNGVAQSLRRGKSRTVAIVLGDISNLLFAILTRALEGALRSSGFQVMIFSTEESPERELQAIKTAISQQVGGVILCPCQQSREGLKLLRRHGIPWVLMGRYFADAEEDAVFWDDRTGGTLATRHLIAKGCRRILFLNGPLWLSSAVERREGYLQAMEEAGLEPFEQGISALARDAQPTLARAWASAEPIDGLFAFSDLIALEAARWIQERGLLIPRQVRVVGFDDIQSHIGLPFGLSSIAADKQDEARQIVSLLFRRMEDADAPARQIRIPVHLAVRSSSEG